MANEAVLRDRINNALNFTWYSDAVGGEKGTIVKLSGGRTVAPCSADNDVPIGVLAREKIASDGRTEVAVYLNGIFDCYVQDTIAIGDDLVVSSANILKKYTTLDDEKGYVFGKALETATAGSSTQIQVLVGKC
jgi:hypothetical protein